MARVLLVYSKYSSFVEADDRILQEAHEVIHLNVRRRFSINILQLWHQMKEIDVVLSWHGSWHSIIPFIIARLRGKPRLLIVGGYDTANEPEIAYGLRQPGFKRIISDLVYQLTNRAFAISNYIYKEALANTPLTADRLSELRLGAIERWPYDPFVPKQRLAITVGEVKSDNLLRKGLFYFIEAARLLPDVEFVVVGRISDDFDKSIVANSPPNLRFTDFVSNEELAQYMQDAQIYVQASHHEGFGMAVAEAMLAGCIPVVSNRGSLPEVVGNTGVIAEDLSPQGIAKAVEHALNMSHAEQALARQRILETFPIERRRKHLLAAFARELEDVT